jgi:hypothetical protein
MLHRLDESAKQLRQFTADASHELRTPVALIRTTAELTLRKERTPEQYQEAVRGIQKDAERLTELVQNLMELARADAGQSRFSLARLDLRDLLIWFSTWICRSTNFPSSATVAPSDVCCWFFWKTPSNSRRLREECTCARMVCRAKSSSKSRIRESASHRNTYPGSSTGSIRQMTPGQAQAWGSDSQLRTGL